MSPSFASYVLVVLSACCAYGQYQPTWDSLDKRPLPSWYDKAKIGIFLHWGVFSVPGFGSEWFWWNWQGLKSQEYVNFMQENYRQGFSYPEFASEFKAEFYDPGEWADLFKASGARYVVLTSKHHEGFTLWPSNVSWNWNARDVGPRRDLLGDLATAIRNKTDIHFGVYHSMFEWFHPLYLMDKNSTWKTQYFVDTKTLPELVELVMKYRPEVIWSDGDWEAPDTYWKSTEFLAWLYNKSPVKDVVVVNDRWGAGMPCHHGGFFTCSDKYNPKTLQSHKWENAMTLDSGSWGYRRNVMLSDFLSVDELITTLAETVSCGGNLLMNVGPTPDGRIIPVFEERLRQMGSWLKINGEAIYETTPWTSQNDTLTPGVWYTTKKANGSVSVYAIVLNWPEMNQLLLGSLQLGSGDVLYMLGVEQPLAWQRISPVKTLVIFPALTPENNPSQWAWVLKVTRSASEDLVSKNKV